jgi:hypothetical protein
MEVVVVVEFVELNKAVSNGKGCLWMVVEVVAIVVERLVRIRCLWLRRVANVMCGGWLWLWLSDGVPDRCPTSRPVSRYNICGCFHSCFALICGIRG